MAARFSWPPHLDFDCGSSAFSSASVARTHLDPMVTLFDGSDLGVKESDWSKLVVKELSADSGSGKTTFSSINGIASICNERHTLGTDGDEGQTFGQLHSMDSATCTKQAEQL